LELKAETLGNKKHVDADSVHGPLTRSSDVVHMNLAALQATAADLSASGRRAFWAARLTKVKVDQLRQERDSAKDNHARQTGLLLLARKQASQDRQAADDRQRQGQLELETKYTQAMERMVVLEAELASAQIGNSVRAQMAVKLGAEAGVDGGEQSVVANREMQDIANTYMELLVNSEEQVTGLQTRVAELERAAAETTALAAAAAAALASSEEKNKATRRESKESTAVSVSVADSSRVL
jgi:hypothetical protein